MKTSSEVLVNLEWWGNTHPFCFCCFTHICFQDSRITVGAKLKAEKEIMEAFLLQSHQKIGENDLPFKGWYSFV